MYCHANTRHEFDWDASAYPIVQGPSFFHFEVSTISPEVGMPSLAAVTPESPVVEPESDLSEVAPHPAAVRPAAIQIATANERLALILI